MPESSSNINKPSGTAATSTQPAKKELRPEDIDWIGVHPPELPECKDSNAKATQKPMLTTFYKYNTRQLTTSDAAFASSSNGFDGDAGLNEHIQQKANARESRARSLQKSRESRKGKKPK